MINSNVTYDNEQSDKSNQSQSNSPNTMNATLIIMLSSAIIVKSKAMMNSNQQIQLEDQQVTAGSTAKKAMKNCMYLFTVHQMILSLVVNQNGLNHVLEKRDST